MPEIITVSTLNRYVKSILDGDSNLQSVYIKGQISNFKNHFQTGHYYFSLKDEKAQVRAVMFRSANQKLRFMPENDMSVIVRAHISVYEAGGDYQVYVDDMQPDGTGALALAFEQLKKKLAAEGLFDETHKKSLPAFPLKIGVVTSENGAAFRDIVNIISRRFPLSEIILAPVSVQGPMAAEQISEAVDKFNEKMCADVLIVGRGGGSAEDLWSFNEEPVVRAVYRSKIPVISAVGHETDVTLCDWAADLRAPTPSAAAELAVPDMIELFDKISSYKESIYADSVGVIESFEVTVKNLSKLIYSYRPGRAIENHIIKLDNIVEKLNSAAFNYLSEKEKKLMILIAGLDSVSPLTTLSRGYSIVTKDSATVTDSSLLKKGDRLNIRFSKGSAECEVI